MIELTEREKRFNWVIKEEQCLIENDEGSQVSLLEEDIHAALWEMDRMEREFKYPGITEF